MKREDYLAGDVLRTEFNLVGSDGIAASAHLSAYLNRSDLETLYLSDSATARGRIAQLHNLTYAQLSLPSAHFRWRRQRSSGDRAVVLILISGTGMVESEGRSVIQRSSPEGQLFFIPPGNVPVDLRFTAAQNQIFYMSISARKMSDVPSVSGHEDWGPFDSELMAPLVAFSARLCALSMMQGVDVTPLRDASEEVAFAMARLIAGSSSEQRSLFEQAMEVIAREYRNKRLDTSMLASRFGVAPRTLQSAFSEHGMSVAVSLRKVRTSVAVQLRHTNPQLTAVEVADATGFGSTASYYRAMRSFEADAQL